MPEYKYVIAIREKVPVLVSGPPYIVTDNSDYMLELLPDSEWDGFEAKTVYYAYDNGTSVQHPIMGNSDVIPVIQTSGAVHIGVSAGELHTTRYLSIPLRASIRRKSGAQIPPPESDVYDQIMEMLNEVSKTAGIQSVTVEEGTVTGDGGEGEYITYFLVIKTTGGGVFRTRLPNMEVDPAEVVQLHNGAPTLETPGKQHQLLVDTSTGAMYVCVSAMVILGEYQYTWQQVGGTGGGSITAIPDGDVLELDITGYTVSTDGDVIVIE